MSDWLDEVPAPRPEVVALLAGLMADLDRDRDPAAAAAYAERRAWTTGAERAEAYAAAIGALTGEAAYLRSVSDQLGAFVRDHDDPGGVA